MRTNTDFQANGTINTPVTRNPRKNDAWFDADFICPIAKMFGLTVSRYFAVVAAVSLLRRIVRPTNIAFFVMPVFVNPVKRQTGGRFGSDFCQKFFKGIESKLDSASAVMTKELIFRISTAIFGSLVSGVFGCVTKSVFYSFCVSGAAARLRSSASQILCIRKTMISAIAFTEPQGAFVLLSRVTDDVEFSKRLSGQINKFWVCWYRLKDGVKIFDRHNLLHNSRLWVGLLERCKLSCEPFFILP